MGGLIVCDSLSGCMPHGLIVSSPVISVSHSCLMKLPGKGICDNWVPLGGPVFRQIRGVQRKPLLVAVFRWLELKIISIRKQHTLGGQVLNSCGHIWGAYSAALYHLPSWCRGLRGVGGWRGGRVVRSSVFSTLNLRRLIDIPPEIPQMLLDMWVESSEKSELEIFVWTT